MNTSEMTREQRKAAARSEYLDIDEGYDYLIRSYLQEKYNLNDHEMGEVMHLGTTTTAKPQNQTCHYCGCRATGYGFFDEPVCEDCK